MLARFARPLALFALAGLTLGCGSSSPKGGTFQPSGRLPDASSPATNPTDPSAPPTTIPLKQINKAVLDRYREYQKIYRQVYETNDPAPLADVAMDPLLAAVTQDVKATAAKGEIWRFTNVLNPKIQARSKDNSVVVILDCVHTLAAYRFSVRTGKRLSTQDGETKLYQVALRYNSGAWKVSNAKWGKKC